MNVLPCPSHIQDATTPYPIFYQVYIIIIRIISENTQVCYLLVVNAFVRFIYIECISSSSHFRYIIEFRSIQGSQHDLHLTRSLLLS